MIDAARDFGEQISGIGISKGCRLIDGLSCGLAECGERSGDGKHVFLRARDAKRIGYEKRALGRYLDGAICRAPQSAGSLRNKVGIVLHLGRDFVEQLVDCDEAWPTHIPMRLLHLRMQVNRSRKMLVQEFDGLRTNVL